MNEGVARARKHVMDEGEEDGISGLDFAMMMYLNRSFYDEVKFDNSKHEDMHSNLWSVVIW